MSFSLSHPVNTALLLYILYLLQRIVFPSTSVPRTPPTEFKAGYSWMPRNHAPALLFTTYTPRSLTKFNGQDGGRILLAIARTVFDVTAGRGFYGPGEYSLPHQVVRALFVVLTEYYCFKTGCMGTLRGGTHQGVWRSSRLISARSRSCLSHCYLLLTRSRWHRDVNVDRPATRQAGGSHARRDVSAVLIFSKLKMLTLVLFGLLLKREHEGLE